MENLQKKPKKSILKSSSSFEQPECQAAKSTTEPIKWDESNILETLHPADKDYGFDRISEPKTPYSYYDNEDSGPEGANAEHGGESSKIELSSIMKNIDRPARIMISSEPSDESDDEALTKEERIKKKDFEFKRKLHYNEYQAVKLARKLLEEEDDEDEESTNDKKDESSSNSKDMDHHFESSSAPCLPDKEDQRLATSDPANSLPIVTSTLTTMTDSFNCTLRQSDEYRDFRSKFSRQKIILDDDPTKCWTFYDTGPKDIKCPIIFLPCVSGTADIFFLQLTELHKRGFRAISLQYPTYWSVKDFIVGFLAFIDYYKFENVHLFGASLGGFLAQKFVEAMNKYVASIILCNSFSDTSIFYRTDTAPIFWLLPQPILKRRIMGKRVLDSSTDKSIQDSIEFMNLSLESLTQKELASRLTLNCSNSYVKPQRLKDIHITIIDVYDRNALSEQAREELYKMYPNSKRASLKDGGSFPFLSRFEDVNLHILIHLRQFDETSLSARKA